MQRNCGEYKRRCELYLVNGYLKSTTTEFSVASFQKLKTSLSIHPLSEGHQHPYSHTMPHSLSEHNSGRPRRTRSPSSKRSKKTKARFSLLPLLLLAGSVHAADQQTTAFTDPLTNISFQRFLGARTGFSFGIALPENPSTDFIGQMSTPMPNRQGWGGVALQGDMEGPLLLCAWPNGDAVVSTFRVAKNEDDSPPVVTGNFRVTPIDQGTVVNDTHMTFTFLCQNCIGDAKTSFTAQDTAGDFEMGWALADTPVSNAADPAAILGFHNVGMYH